MFFTPLFSNVLPIAIGLKAGDCGSWAIDSSSQEVYGHIVASDIFGEAYVIPLNDALRDMQKKLGVKSVSLPIGRETVDWLLLYFNLSGFVHSQDDPLQNSTDDIQKGKKCPGRTKPLPPTTVLSHRKGKSHQSVLGKCAVKKIRSLSHLSSEVPITNFARGEIKLPPSYHCSPHKPLNESKLLYHSSPYKTLVVSRITDDTRTTFGGDTLTASKQDVIRSSGSSHWNIPEKLRESFKHVSSKLANATARTDKPTPLPEHYAYARSPSSHDISQRMPGLDHEISGSCRPRDPTGMAQAMVQPKYLRSYLRIGRSRFRPELAF